MTLFRLPAALALTGLALAAWTATAAHAAPTQRGTEVKGAEIKGAEIKGAEVVVGGTLIHTVRTSWAGRGPQQRAAQVQERLNTLLGQGPVSPGDITVGRVQSDWCVLFRGQRFLTADLPAAQQNHSNPEALAGRWAAHLRQVLPDLTKPPRR